jgi:hypothetical protein
MFPPVGVLFNIVIEDARNHKPEIVDQVACVCGDVCMGASSVLHCEKHFIGGNMDNTNLPCSF